MSTEVALVIAFVLAIGLVSVGYATFSGGFGSVEDSIVGSGGLLGTVENSDGEEYNPENPSLSDEGG